MNSPARPVLFALTTLALCAPRLHGQGLRSGPDPDTRTFEVFLASYATQDAQPRSYVIAADELELSQWNLVVLRRHDSPVAVFPVHQVVLAVERDVEASRIFDIIPQEGAPISIEADRMTPMQNSLVTYHVGERLVGISSNSGAQIVLERGAVMGPGRRGDRPVRIR